MTNRTISEINAVGRVTEYAYNYLGQLASYTSDGGGSTRSTTSYEYDLAGNLTKEISPLGNVTHYTYDQEGNVLTKTDENGTETSYEYDKWYRLTSRSDDDGVARFKYDGLSNILEAENSAGTVRFTYDALSRTTEVNENGAVTTYIYDAKGNRQSITYPDNKAVSYTYDANGNVTQMIDYDATGIAYTYDAEGRVKKEAYTDGSTTEYTYNAAGLLMEMLEVMKDHSTRRKITYSYDDNGNLTSEVRTGIDISNRTESVLYAYDKANQLIKTTVDGKTTGYAYDTAGNLLSDGTSTFTYDKQNRLLSKTDADGATSYTYDAAGNLISESSPNGTTTYTYNAQNRLVKGVNPSGESSEYTYNALGARVQNVQTRINQNAGHQNSDLKDGSHGTDYLDFLKDNRADWQPAWETEIGTTVQNERETITKTYVVDYLSLANRDILVTEKGGFTQRYVYDANGTRISAEYDYAEGTERNTQNAKNEYGENLRSDIAVKEIGKVWFRTSMLGSTLFVVDENGETVSHTIYDAWGAPLAETYIDANFSGLDNVNNFTGYAHDEVLNLYFAQNRFYDASTHRFTQEDIIKDGANWYIYCGNNPGIWVDAWGLEDIVVSGGYYREGDGYKYEFIDSALREMISHSSDERSTLLIADYGLTQEDKNRIAFYGDVNGFNVVYFYNTSELNNYLNNGANSERKDDPITSFTVFSHGYAGSVEFGYGLDISEDTRTSLSWTTDKIKDLDPAAFNKTTSDFYSCNTGTKLDGTSFAQEWSNLTKGTTTAAVGRTDYEKINGLVWWNFDGWLGNKVARRLAGGDTAPYPAFNAPGLGSNGSWHIYTPVSSPTPSLPRTGMIHHNYAAY